jgi:hypothetical protein
MFCKNCGEEVTGNFCGKCGASVGELDNLMPGAKRVEIVDSTLKKRKLPLPLKIAITILCDIPLIYILFPCLAFVLRGDLSLFSIIGSIWSLGMLYLVNVHIYIAKKPMDNTTKIVVAIVSVALGISLLFLGLLP